MPASKSPPPIDKQQIKLLMEKRDFPGVIKFCQCLLLIFATGYLLSVAEHPGMQALLTLVLGLFLTFLFAPLHESIHKTAFASPWLNQAVGVICGFILLLPPKSFQAFHMAHHRYTQIYGKDPELDTDQPTTWPQYFWNVSGLPYWAGQIKAIMLFAIGDHQPHYVNDAKHSGVVFEARIYLAIYFAMIIFSLTTGSDILWKVWILPVLLGQPLLRVFLIAEHALCPEVEDMYENTRTTATNSPMRWLCWNMSFHTEHHAYPGIPFHQLPRTHTLLKPHIKIISNGYIAVNREVMRSFRINR